MKQPFFLLIAIIFFHSTKGYSQNKDSTASFKVSGYVDAYFAYYNDSVGTNNYQKFPVISPKSNVFGLNIAQFTGQYVSQKVRATATIHYGDIPSSAWSPVLNIIQEANAGFRISNKLWVDAGLFKTHIGTEALLPKDNIASSLSMITFYEPWWQAGMKLSFAPNDKFLLCLHVLNGYNTYVDNNKKKSVGITFNYYFNNKGNISYYNLLGDESPEGNKPSQFRVLHNLVFTYQITPKLKTIIGADYITQAHSSIADSSKSANVFSGIITLKNQLTDKFGMYVRGEMFSDKNGFLTGTFLDSKNIITGYKSSGVTLGFELKPVENAYIRLEGRSIMMNKDQEIFHIANANKNTYNRFETMLNMGVWF